MSDKICFVVQRYGLEVNGGAELLCRLFAEKMRAMYEIDVLTTKAKDYVTWKDEYTSNDEIINEIHVIRFPVAATRDLNIFNNINNVFHAGNLPLERESEWIEKQGPYCPELIKYLEKHQFEYKVIIFFTYLYYPTVMGIKSVSQKSIIMPFAHDEPYFRMHIFDDMFTNIDGIVYSTEEERKFIQNKYKNNKVPFVIGGSGIDLPETIDGKRFREKYNISDYIVYTGRIDVDKNCNELFEFFSLYKQRNPNNLKLVLMGKSSIPIPQTKDIVFLGFVSDQDKFDGIAGAKALVLPSKFESLSMVVLEAMSVHTNVIVNGECTVLKGHCKKSNGAFYYNNFFEFEGELNYLLNPKNAEVVAQMKENAKAYVDKYYQWDAITKRLHNLIEEICEIK